jgi:hypothetical protein
MKWHAIYARAMYVVIIVASLAAAAAASWKWH